MNNKNSINRIRISYNIEGVMGSHEWASSTSANMRFLSSQVRVMNIQFGKNTHWVEDMETVIRKETRGLPTNPDLMMTIAESVEVYKEVFMHCGSEVFNDMLKQFGCNNFYNQNDPEWIGNIFKS